MKKLTFSLTLCLLALVASITSIFANAQTTTTAKSKVSATAKTTVHKTHKASKRHKARKVSGKPVKHSQQSGLYQRSTNQSISRSDPAYRYIGTWRAEHINNYNGGLHIKFIEKFIFKITELGLIALTDNGKHLYPSG